MSREPRKTYSEAQQEIGDAMRQLGRDLIRVWRIDDFVAWIQRRVYDSRAQHKNWGSR